LTTSERSFLLRLRAPPDRVLSSCRAKSFQFSSNSSIISFRPGERSEAATNRWHSRRCTSLSMEIAIGCLELPDDPSNPDVDEWGMPWKSFRLRLRGQPREEIAIGLTRMYLEAIESIFPPLLRS